jgi:hypothetical protein
MYEILPSADRLFAVRLGETLTADEIEALYEAVGKRFESQPRLNYYVDATAYRHIGPEAFVEGVKQRLAHLGWLSRFDRVAIVTDSPLIRTVANVFDVLTPSMAVRVFEPDKAAEALAWAGETSG